jgi:hypothetical protein
MKPREMTVAVCLKGRKFVLERENTHCWILSRMEGSVSNIPFAENFWRRRRKCSERRLGNLRKLVFLVAIRGYSRGFVYRQGSRVEGGPVCRVLGFQRGCQ